MKFTPKRLLAAGVVAVAAIATPVSLSAVLPGVGNSPRPRPLRRCPTPSSTTRGRPAAPSSTFLATGRLRRLNP